MRVLVVEDYPPLASSVPQALREASFAVDLATDGDQALLMTRTTSYDAIVLDVMLPKVDGLTVLKQLRQRGDQAGIVLLTARDGVEQRVQGLDAGADDYLVKPFAIAELIARVRSLVRRKYQSKASTVVIGDLEIDTVARAVRRAGRAITLSAREFDLLEYLALRTGHIVSRSDIAAHLYDVDEGPASNVVDVYIGYLRKKIDADAAVKLIHTRRGHGYVLEVEA